MRKNNRRYQDKYLDNFLTTYYNSVEHDTIGQYKECSRLALLNMEPYSSLKNKLPKTGEEKDAVLTLILSQIKQFKISEQQLEDKSRELGNKLLSKCVGCKNRYEEQCAHNGRKKLTWNRYFSTNYYDFCSPDPEVCKNSTLIIKDLSLNSIINERQKLLVEHKNLEISYKVALEQQSNLVELYTTLISRYRENNAILIFKKNDIQHKINYIQLSVIFISAIITLFETIKPTISPYMTPSLLMVFPIALSTYIGLILAVGRFFKFDTKNEQIIKLIEKYSFIINKFVQKKDKAANFDFKFKNVKKWDELLELEEKDNITDIILKASEERDIVLTPKEHVFYKKKYTEIYLKEQIESINLDTLSYLVNNTNNQDENINKLVQNIIVKEPFFKYYFCCLWCCKHREYVDYEKVMLKEAALITKEDLGRREDEIKKHTQKLEENEKKKDIVEAEKKFQRQIAEVKAMENAMKKARYGVKAQKNALMKNTIRKQPPTADWFLNPNTGFNNKFRSITQKPKNTAIEDLSNNTIIDVSNNTIIDVSNKNSTSDDDFYYSKELKRWVIPGEEHNKDTGNN